MADGTIKIDISVNGKEVQVAAKSLDQLEASGKDAGKGVKDTEDGLKGASKESQKASGSFKQVATALGLVAIGAAAFNVLRKNMDAAISRFDTLNNFPRVLQSMGFEAEESERAINKLSDGIDGLPTKLDDVASTAQKIAVMTGDLDGAVDTTLALNNAFLASGASSADASRGLDQYVQMLAKGEVDLQSWRTLQETMPVALSKTAEAFKFTGESAQNDLYDALKSGQIEFKEFNAKIIELSNATGGFADVAKESSTGFATSMANLRNAVVKGVADIIGRFNKLSEEVTGKEIPEHINSLKSIINASFSAIGTIIEKTTPIVAAFAAGVSATLPIVKALTPAILGAVAAYTGLLIVTKVRGAIAASNAILATAQVSTEALTLATRAQIAATMTNTKVTKADALATVAQTGAIKLSTLAVGVLTGKINIAKAATIAWAAAKKALMGPIGWVTAGIGALAGATIAVVKWFNKSSAEAEKMKEETEELSKATDELIDGLKNSSDAYKDNVKEITASAGHSENLAKKIADLSAKENKSAADKALLKSHIEALNGSVDGLSLAYDDQADSLNMSSEELKARIALMKEEEKGIAGQERLAEIAAEQIETQLKLNEVIELQEKLNKQQADGTVTASEYQEEVAKLTEKEDLLREVLVDLGEQYGITEEQVDEAAANAAAAVEEGNLRQITSYEELKDAQKAAFDSMKTTYDELVYSATNAFDRMNDESKVTAAEMISNLEHNQAVTAQWADNVAKLMESAGEEGNEGFIAWLETMGPDSAAELAVVADMSEDELKRFKELMNSAPREAADNLKTSLGEGLDEAVDVMVNFVDNGSQSLREQIKKANFEEIGSMMPESLKGAVEDGTPGVEKATEEMGKRAIHATKDVLEINSPSKVYKGFGGNITDGLSLGIRTGTAVVLRAVQTMFSRVLVNSNASFRRVNSSFKRGTSMIRSTMVNQFQSIGLNAMSGLNVGLNAGSGRVMATANRIANSVAATMRKALDIHSPSRVLQEIGKFAGQGFIAGIDSMTRKVKLSSENMANAAIPGNSRFGPMSAASPRIKSSEKTRRNTEKIMEIFYKFTEAYQ